MKERPYITCSRMETGMLLHLARQNRKHPIEAESVMWDLLRNKFYNVKFRRQHVVGQYIVDFLCMERNLLIEIDGGYHSTAEQKYIDEQRTENLSAKGLTVLRFTNEDVLSDIETVSQRIKNYIIKELI